MPSLLIDVSRLFYRGLIGRPPTGIDRITREYVRRHADTARAVLTLGPFSSVLDAEESANLFNALLDHTRLSIARALRILARAYFRWWVRPDLRNSILVNTDHTGLDYSGYGREIHRKGVPAVLVISDLIPITHPEYFWPREGARHRRRMRNALGLAQGIVAISQATLEDLARFAGQGGLPMPRAIAAPLASGLPEATPGPRPMQEPYFVVIGTIEPRKNHVLLLELWRDLVTSYKVQGSRDKLQGTGDKAPTEGGAIPRLVIIGRRGWECESAVDLLERCRQLRGYVFEHNTCSDGELVTYLRHAQALLFPTFVEGYGLPVAEALSSGTPVIASDLPVFRETAGSVPDYIDPLDGRRWMELILDYAHDGPLRNAQLERMKSFTAPTWEQHFEKVDEFLELLGEGRQSTSGNENRET